MEYRLRAYARGQAWRRHHKGKGRTPIFGGRNNSREWYRAVYPCASHAGANGCTGRFRLQCGSCPSGAKHTPQISKPKSAHGGHTSRVQKMEQSQRPCVVWLDKTMRMEGKAMVGIMKERKPWRLWTTAIVIAITGVLLSFCLSCSPRIIEKEVVRTLHDTLHLVDKQRDSIFQRDSIYLVEKWIGDTLIREKIREKVLSRVRTKHDTIYKVIIKEDKEKIIKEKRPPTMSIAALIKFIIVLLAILVIVFFRLKIKKYPPFS